MKVKEEEGGRREHHLLNGHEYGQILCDNEGQGSLVCYSSWGHKQLDRTWQLKNNNIAYLYWEKNEVQKSFLFVYNSLCGLNFPRKILIPI